jgi:transcriptional regulator with XRE-family HTH domain
MNARESFGPTLRQQRERRGVTLAAIAERTKISPQLLRSLERGDVSRWPGGIYRRAFVRAYAAAIGLPPEPTLLEFVRLFPEPGQEPPALLDEDDPRRLRMTLVPEAPWKAPVLRASAVVVDVAIVLFAAHVVATLAGIGFWMPAALVGISYHATGALLLGRSAGAVIVSPGVTPRRPDTERDQVARLRHALFPGMADVSDGSREHRATT